MGHLVAFVGRQGLLSLIGLGHCLCSEVEEGMLLAGLHSWRGLLPGLCM